MATPVVVDRVSIEIVQANVLWGFLGGLLGLFAGVLGIIGIVIGAIALALSWIWTKTSARMKMFLFGFGLVSLFGGILTAMLSVTMTSLGLKSDEVKGLGWIGGVLSVPTMIGQKSGFDKAILNVEPGTPTAEGMAAWSRLFGSIGGGVTASSGSVGGVA